jgi:hypothetical protein
LPSTPPPVIPSSSQATPGLAGGVVVSSESGLTKAQLEALKLLCEKHPGAVGVADLGIGSDVYGPISQVRLTVADQRVFDGQWREAANAALLLSTSEQASAAGYVLASGFDPGVGIHWIKWSLVGQPFDPSTPSMLLFEGLPGRATRLVGFSYWVGSRGQPAGFAGPNDRWHRHGSLCFDTKGQLVNSRVAGGPQCADGYWLNGRDLWMLHAWVVPGLQNIWGDFAPANPYLCPRPLNVPDVASCQSR